ncbi:hypothetical protein [Paenibacillus eucommiae]|uniref:Uncharacterized protein n=1 Tax=Paenibacillus eucommiae TaxID=1355755 RepID=A0ABS4IQ07_9BACL|nr:hypothetical protein [Paenibacillus eucommiae]MBP1989642.1 hypothetical protein [Paenibacillus eucommiae]
MTDFQRNTEARENYVQKGNQRPPAGVKEEIHSSHQVKSDGQHPPPDKRKNKHRFWMGIMALVLFATFFFFDSSSLSGNMKDVQSNGIGKGMMAGTILTYSDDSAGLQPRNFELEMKKGMDTSRVLIWDYAAEDGDVVTVKVNGQILVENVGIFHKPVVLQVPIPSTVEIVGIKDGGGGITYGVKFPGAVANSAYFNAAPVGSSNVYTLRVIDI